jgi:ribosomal protein L13E
MIVTIISPISTMRRNKIVKVSLSEQEYEKLVTTATYKGVSPSEFLRDVVKSLSAIHPEDSRKRTGRGFSREEG